MKILICCESERLRAALRQGLEAAGHEVAAEAESRPLGDGAPEAGALLVDAPRGRRSIALLRDRGFAGRSLLAGEAAQEELSRLAVSSGADGALALAPTEDLPRRFARAIGGRRRVLVLDESAVSGRLVGEQLKEAGFDSQHATTLKDATGLMLRRATRPDLVLVDAKLARVSGAQLCRFIKKNDRFRSIRVVLCSGGDRKEAAAIAGECGADGYVLRSELLGT